MRCQATTQACDEAVFLVRTCDDFNSVFVSRPETRTHTTDVTCMAAKREENAIPDSEAQHPRRGAVRLVPLFTRFVPVLPILGMEVYRRVNGVRLTLDVSPAVTSVHDPTSLPSNRTISVSPLPYQFTVSQVSCQAMQEQKRTMVRASTFSKGTYSCLLQQNTDKYRWIPH